MNNANKGEPMHPLWYVAAVLVVVGLCWVLIDGFEQADKRKRQHEEHKEWVGRDDTRKAFDKKVR
jgi:hypothetical protein